MNPETTNAIAGPSNLRNSPGPSSSATSKLFLPPPAPHPAHPAHLSSTQDLLARFHLLSAYDTYVRPFANSPDAVLEQRLSAPTPAVNGVLDKGKGKEVVSTPDAAGVPEHGDGNEEDGAKGDKKKKNNYRHLIKGVPGKHSFKKDEYLWTMMQIPPKQRIPIQPFDVKTQREAFTVSLEGLKGWNSSVLILESPQAREDRKKRRELKRLQRLQAQTQAQATLQVPLAQPQPIQASFMTPASASSATRISAGATMAQRPDPTIPRPGSAIPIPGFKAAKPVVGPPGRVSTPSRSDLMSSGTPTRATIVATPALPATNPYQTDTEKRGVKRERDDTVAQSPVMPIGAMPVNGNLPANQPKSVLNAKAGIAGVRPRPVKRPRMDIQGQTSMAMTQQPTPQGV